MCPSVETTVARAFVQEDEIPLKDPEVFDEILQAETIAGTRVASATRELLHMSETIEFMLHEIMLIYERSDKRTIGEFASLDDIVDTAHTEIKRYLAQLSRQKLTGEEAKRCQELTNACIKLEQAGDIVVRNLLKHADKKRQRKLNFSTKGWTELTELHNIVVENCQLALNVLVSRDLETARQLIESKDQMRELERECSKLHLDRLGDGTPESIESSEVHLDTIRDLKQINSLLASFAYPVLENEGQLLHSRLVSSD